MVIPPSFRAALSATLGGLLVAFSAPAPARAAAVDQIGLRQEMANYLADYPGGRAINNNEISYQGGAFVVTLRAPIGVLATADCPSGWYCFYELPNFGYPRGRLSSCGRQNLATWQWQYRIESAHYNLGSGSVSFYYNSTKLFTIGTGNRVRSDADPYREWPNYVDRYCP
ncbi:peptidase inhibitor family I36 protein [Micromonospora profundi]|uniref:peptidase inhibitor family I36 protein n=1 Tax=Micromonospora profundi TaxID=1420889 RepID=UPI003812A7C1